MLFTDVQNLVDIVSNLRGTFDFRRPWPIKAMPVAGGGWWVVGGAAIARRSEWCCQQNKRRAFFCACVNISSITSRCIT